MVMKMQNNCLFIGNTDIYSDLPDIFECFSMYNNNTRRKFICAVGDQEVCLDKLIHVVPYKGTKRWWQAVNTTGT